MEVGRQLSEYRRSYVMLVVALVVTARYWIVSSAVVRSSMETRAGELSDLEACRERVLRRLFEWSANVVAYACSWFCV